MKKEAAHHLVLTTQKKKKIFGFVFIEGKEGSKGPEQRSQNWQWLSNHLWERAFFAPRLCFLYSAAWAPARPSLIEQHSTEHSVTSIGCAPGSQSTDRAPDTTAPRHRPTVPLTHTHKTPLWDSLRFLCESSRIREPQH